MSQAVDPVFEDLHSFLSLLSLSAPPRSAAFDFHDGIGPIALGAMLRSIDQTLVLSGTNLTRMKAMESIEGTGNSSDSSGSFSSCLRLIFRQFHLQVLVLQFDESGLALEWLSCPPDSRLRPMFFSPTEPC
jgi:hypothetical protein